jgi:hypothetical protein
MVHFGFECTPVVKGDHPRQIWRLKREFLPDTAAGAGQFLHKFYALHARVS